MAVASDATFDLFAEIAAHGGLPALFGEALLNTGIRQAGDSPAKNIQW